MERLNAVVEGLSKALLVCAGIAMTAMMLHICADVVARYLFNKPFTGTLEIVAWYYMVACVFLPVAYVQARRQHLMVEVFTLGLNKRQTAILDAVVALLSLAYVALLTWLVFNAAVGATAKWEIKDVTFFDLPVWPVRWFLPLSFGLMSIVLILQAINDFWYGFTGEGRPTLDIVAGEAMTLEQRP